MKPLASPTSLLGQALKLYLSKNYRYWFILLGLIPTIVSFLFSFGMSLITQYITDLGLAFTLFIVILALIIALVSVLFYIFLYRFTYIAALGGTINLGIIVSQSWKRITKLIITNLLMIVFILIGLVLLVIPGLVFAVWYYFAPIIAVIEDPKIDALKTSKNLVQGIFWPVTGRIVIFSAIAILPGIMLQQLSPYLSLIWQIFTPYFSLVTLLFYLDLKSTKNP